MTTSAITAKVRKRLDTYHPHLALREIQAQMEKRGKRVWRRLFTLADDPDPSVALRAIALIKDSIGLDAFLKAQIDILKEQAINDLPPQGGATALDPEEDQRAVRRAKVLKETRRSAKP